MTSNLEDLPVSNQIDKNNITLQTNEKNTVIESSINNIQQQRENDLKQSIAEGQGPGYGKNKQNSNENNININEFVTSIQNAVSNGSLSLPSRDIPQSQNHLTQDQEVKHNFIPGDSNDYIDQDRSRDDIINDYLKKQQKNNKIDDVYNQLQTPILMAVLYFIFQLPVVKKMFLNFFPTFYHKDGNLNLTGFIVNSVLFAISYYIINYSIDYFSI
tara:strand:+ start:4352 stop:4996 length:645 start_codon:yes stop_codon:yes gene_type:complete